MPIILLFSGVLLVALSDKLQPNAHRKPKLNFYLGSLGGILWFAGAIWCFMSYELLHAILLLVGSFVVGAILGVRK